MAENKISFWILTALVVGNMVGSGIFMLPRTLSEAASPAGVLLGWGVTGFGVLFLALVFGNLAIRKPELHGGPQIYAKELFPKIQKPHLYPVLCPHGVIGLEILPEMQQLLQPLQAIYQHSFQY